MNNNPFKDLHGVNISGIGKSIQVFLFFVKLQLMHKDIRLLWDTTNCIRISLLHMCFASDPVKQIKQLQTSLGDSSCKPAIVGVKMKVRTSLYTKLQMEAHRGLNPTTVSCII